MSASSTSKHTARRTSLAAHFNTVRRLSCHSHVTLITQSRWTTACIVHTAFEPPIPHCKNSKDRALSSIALDITAFEPPHRNIFIRSSSTSEDRALNTPDTTVVPRIGPVHCQLPISCLLVCSYLLSVIWLSVIISCNDEGGSHRPDKYVHVITRYA